VIVGWLVEFMTKLLYLTISTFIVITVELHNEVHKKKKLQYGCDEIAFSLHSR